MKKLSARLLAVVLTLSVISAFAQHQELQFEGLPNLHRVNQRLYRGGQPKPDGLKRLAELGVKTIVNLRGESGETHAEEAQAKALGLQFFSIPMSNVGRPTDEQMTRVMEIIEANENAPTFIHCLRGADRTGAVIAVYRIKHDGWTADRALDEAKRHGMGLIQFQKRDYVRDYFNNRPGAVR